MERVALRLYVDKEALQRFARFAQAMYRSLEPEEAAVTLIENVVEWLPDTDDTWTVFLPLIPIETRKTWDEIAAHLTRTLRALPSADGLPDALAELYEIAKETELTAQHAVYFFVRSGDAIRYQFDRA